MSINMRHQALAGDGVIADLQRNKLLVVPRGSGPPVGPRRNRQHRKTEHRHPSLAQNPIAQGALLPAVRQRQVRILTEHSDALHKTA